MIATYASIPTVSSRLIIFSVPIIVSVAFDSCSASSRAGLCSCSFMAGDVLIDRFKLEMVACLIVQLMMEAMAYHATPSMIGMSIVIPHVMIILASGRMGSSQFVNVSISPSIIPWLHSIILGLIGLVSCKWIILHSNHRFIKSSVRTPRGDHPVIMLFDKSSRLHYSLLKTGLI